MAPLPVGPRHRSPALSCVVWTASSFVVCIPREKRATRYPWRDSAPPRSLPLIILFIIEDIVLIVLVSILNGLIQFEEVALLLVVPFIKACQRRFEGLRVLLLHLNVLEGCWEDRCLWLLIPGGESRRMVKGLVARWQAMI